MKHEEWQNVALYLRWLLLVAAICAAGCSRRWLPRAAWRRLQPRLTRLSALPLRTWPLPALQLAAPHVAAAACPTACPCKEGASEPLRWLLLVAAICAAGCSRRWLPRAAGCLAPLAALPLRVAPLAAFWARAACKDLQLAAPHVALPSAAPPGGRLHASTSWRTAAPVNLLPLWEKVLTSI
jgi:hypothetical protein